MSLKDKLRLFVRHNRVILFGRLMFEALCETCSHTKHLGAADMLSDEVKFAADLRIRTHAIEKGMSIGSARVGFGQPKVLALIDDLFLFIRKFPTASIDEAVCVIERYIAYNAGRGCDMPEVKARYEQLLKAYKLRTPLNVGIRELKYSETAEAAQASFDVFSHSRYSIRDFGTDTVVDFKDIIGAIDMARKAPSACNRQPARAHIFKGEAAHKLLDFQGGCKGFANDMQYALLVTADMRQYFINERHQMYVDGGLFAMELLLSLHYKGLATIPLTTSYKSMKTRRMRKEFDIPSYEVPVMIIGVGAFKDEYKVAVSHRNPVEDYYCEHH